ncbi:hypothetical protein niasHT_036559 [Heterodera trifolii]|uniref:Uncharacterized protein n=1 Tax=Heterodera trifolii TaxID=157864 RepID=A0ABD2I846_9BILA
MSGKGGKAKPLRGARENRRACPSGVGIEYMTAEMLDLAGDVSKESKKMRINRRDLQLISILREMGRHGTARVQIASHVPRVRDLFHGLHGLILVHGDRSMMNSLAAHRDDYGIRARADGPDSPQAFGFSGLHSPLLFRAMPSHGIVPASLSQRPMNSSNDMTIAAVISKRFRDILFTSLLFFRLQQLFLQFFCLILQNYSPPIPIATFVQPLAEATPLVLIFYLLP